MSPRFRYSARFAFLSVLALAMVSCEKKAPPPPPPAETAAPPRPVDPPAPDSFSAKFETTKGDFVVQFNRSWAPLGVDRFYRLANEGYFKDVRFFRVIKGFIAQFGMHGDPATNAHWDSLRIVDDPVTHTNKRGTIVFATAGPNTRANQFFINLADNMRLDSMGFSPLGTVTSGMGVVDKLYDAYGGGPDEGGRGPSQGLIMQQGNAYLTTGFPKLDYIKSVTILK